MHWPIDAYRPARQVHSGTQLSVCRLAALSVTGHLHENVKACILDAVTGA